MNTIDRLEELQGSVSEYILTPDWRAKDFHEWSPATAAYIAAHLNAAKPMLAVVRAAEKYRSDPDTYCHELDTALATLKETTL